MDIGSRHLKPEQRLPRTLTPAHQEAYLSGFNAAITLFDQYFQKDKIPYNEAKIRVEKIRSVMMGNRKGNTFSKKNAGMRGRSKS